MQLLPLAVCLFLFCVGHHHPAHRHAPAVQPEDTQDVRPVQHARDLSCNAISSAFDDFYYAAPVGASRDKFVMRYAVPDQRKVLQCLDKTGRGQ